MTTISIAEVQTKVADLIHSLAPGEEVQLTENELPVARIISTPPVAGERKLGTMKGTVLYMAPDFDAPLDEFKEYME